MMDYRVTMSFMHPNKDYMCEDTYESLVWNETELKPTDEELKDYWDTIKYDYLKEIMRNERNQLLKDCDHCALPDFPNRENYILYRQELRELPDNWTIDTPFPQKPT
jgi:hypothetical protein